MGSFDHGNPHDPLPLAPLLVKNVAGDNSEEQVENGHDCTELRGGVRPWIVNNEDDDVQKDAEDVDCETEENGVLALGKRNAPDEATEKYKVVDDVGLKLEDIHRKAYELVIKRTRSPQSPRVPQDINKRWPRNKALSLSLGTSGSSSFISWYPILGLSVSESIHFTNEF